MRSAELLLRADKPWPLATVFPRPQPTPSRLNLKFPVNGDFVIVAGFHQICRWLPWLKLVPGRGSRSGSSRRLALKMYRRAVTAPVGKPGHNSDNITITPKRGTDSPTHSTGS
jgi:hypothetical protein